MIVLALVVISRFLGGPGVSEPDATPGAGIAGDPGEIERGSALFMTNCASCHGATGRGDGPAADSLDPKPADFTAPMHRLHDDQTMIASIVNGVAGSAMPAFAETLSSSEIVEIVAFIRSLQAQFANEQIPIPDPEECMVDPVPPVSFMPAGAITPKPAPTPAPPVGADTFPWPQGDAATQDEIDGVTRTLREFSACANAGDYPRRLALYTDRAIRPQFEALDEAGWQSTLEFVATPPAAMPEGQREWVDSITAVRRLPDGRVGAHVVTIDPINHPHQSAAVVIFAPVGDRWLIDQVHQDTTSPAATSETPGATTGIPVEGLETPVTSAGIIVRMIEAPEELAGGSLVLQITRANGEPVDDASVELAAEMPDMTMGIQVVSAEPQGDGRYVAQVPLGMACDWEFLALVTPPGGEIVQFRFVATIE
jgi:mono/diheme cytochrome c family protein